MLSSFQVASSLLAVERQKERITSAGFPAAPIGLGIVNLIFCAMMEDSIRTDQTDHHLLLFVFAECSAVALLCCGVIGKSMAGIVNRTSIFPIDAWSYLLFFFRGFVTRPILLALLITNGLFIGVLVHESILQVVLCLIYLSLAALIIQLTVAVVALLLIRSSQPVAMFGVLAASFTLVIVGSTLFFNVDSILRAVPVVGWTVQGLTAAWNEDTPEIIKTLAYDAAALAVVGIIGRRTR